MNTIEIDTLISADWVIPVTPEQQVLKDHALAIKDGKIIDSLPISECSEKYHANQSFNYHNHVLIPGLVNAHTHSAMSLLRGIADDLPLMQWLQDHIWPTEAKFVDANFVADGSQLAIAEMISSGTTCFADMYFFPEITAQIALQAQIRCCIGLIVLDFPTVWAANADEYISKGIELHDEVHSNPFITTMFAPHAPYTVSDKPFTKLRTIADELGIPVQCHVHETAEEIHNALEQNGKRPLQRLQELGLLNDSLMAVHMTQIEAHEIEQLATNGTHVIHCPASNMKLASGICPSNKLLKAGVNVALGTDGASSNNDLDMFGEMRTASLLAKTASLDAEAVNAYEALKMATINGAKALGLDNQIGSLEIGKFADIVAVDFAYFNTQPLYEPISQLVYATASHQVNHVWIAGHQVLKNKMLTTLDKDDIYNKVSYWQEKIINR